MQLTKDEAYANHIKQLIVNHVRRPGDRDETKLHVSDLLAPRFSYFKRVLKHEVSEDDIDMFISGIAFHEFLQKVMGAEMAEKVVEWEGILGSIDWLGAVLVEIKTSRKYTIPEFPQEHYIDQAMCYLAMTGRTEGKILVIYFTAGRNPWKKTASKVEIVVWDLKPTTEELDEHKRSMLEVRDYLTAALASKDYSQLPVCDLWRCGSEYKNEIRLCPFYETCQPPGRYPLPVLQKQFKK